MSCSMRMSVISRIEREQEVRQQLTFAPREPRCRFVEHESFRLGRERHRNRDLPVLAVGEGAHELSQLVGDRDLARRFPRLLADLAVLLRQEDRTKAAAADADDRQVDAVLDGETGEEPRLLVRAGEAELGSVARRPSRDVLAEQLDPSGRGRYVSANDVEERRLPGAVRPQDRPTLAVHDVEIDAVHGEQAPETPADPPQAEGRLGVSDDRCCLGHRPT